MLVSGQASHVTSAGAIHQRTWPTNSAMHLINTTLKPVLQQIAASKPYCAHDCGEVVLLFKHACQDTSSTYKVRTSSLSQPRSTLNSSRYPVGAPASLTHCRHGAMHPLCLWPTDGHTDSLSRCHPTAEPYLSGGQCTTGTKLYAHTRMTLCLYVPKQPQEPTQAAPCHV